MGLGLTCPPVAELYDESKEFGLPAVRTAPEVV
jgi:hypothetical protein